MLYSKNGSIPYPYTDGTDGWIEVPDKPETPEGKEVVWWYPPGWVIRDPRPEKREGYEWSWSQSTEQWMEHSIPNTATNVVSTIETPESQSEQIESTESSQENPL